MIVSCPKCKKKFNFDPKARSENVRLRCNACGSIFMVSADTSKESAVKVLVATDDAEIMDAVEGMLMSQNIRVAKTRDGNEVLGLAQSLGPQAVVLDVAIPGLYSFEICEKIKNTPALRNIKVMLLSEAFNQKRYRRKPTSLFGADDFVEKHDIRAELLPKIWRMLGGEPRKGPEEPLKTRDTAPVTERRQAGEPEKAKKSTAPGNTELHERSKRLARVIAADIILYNKEKLDASMNKADIGMVFKNEIEEGIRYFKQRLPLAVDAKNYLDEAIREFLTGRSKGALLKI